MEWIEFEQSKWGNQKLPEERRYVLVQIAPDPFKGLPAIVAVAYLRYAAGCKDSPQFIIPGIGGEVVAWCDCLGDDFFAPLWKK